MKRALFWGTIVAGAVAAYLMYRRGESVGSIAVRTVTNPVGSLVTELIAPIPNSVPERCAWFESIGVRHSGSGCSRTSQYHPFL
jgi:hypothetical protein